MKRVAIWFLLIVIFTVTNLFVLSLLNITVAGLSLPWFIMLVIKLIVCEYLTRIICNRFEIE